MICPVNREALHGMANNLSPIPRKPPNDRTAQAMQPFSTSIIKCSIFPRSSYLRIHNFFADDSICGEYSRCRNHRLCHSLFSLSFLDLGSDGALPDVWVRVTLVESNFPEANCRPSPKRVRPRTVSLVTQEHE